MMNKKFLTLIFVPTLTGTLLLGCAAPMQAAAAPAQTETLRQAVSQVYASVLTEVESRSEATPATACPACGSDDCTNDNCGRQYCNQENTACREQKETCTVCNSDTCDGGQLCTQRDECPRYSTNGHHQSGRHQSGHHGK